MRSPEEIPVQVAPRIGNRVYYPCMTSTFLLGFVPGSFTRHLHSSTDLPALCGAMSVPQGDRRPVEQLLPVNGLTCGACKAAAR